MYRLVAGACKCNLSLALTHSVAGLILEVIKRRGRHVVQCTALSLSCPCSLLPLILLCLHDRSLPWSAPLSSWNRSREASGRSLHTTRLCTKKRIQFPTRTLLCLINEDHRWNSGSTSKYVFTDFSLYVNYWSHELWNLTRIMLKVHFYILKHYIVLLTSPITKKQIPTLVRAVDNNRYFILLFLN